jgi:nanoRNase/pAp phosphatase (c-di-AMP/oligoRNAs hydrolase)
MRHPLYWFDAALSTVEPVITALFIKHINDFNETVTRIMYMGRKHETGQFCFSRVPKRTRHGRIADVI